jgi:hypothetical protein
MAHIFSLGTHTLLAVFAGKQYKPIAHKIRPIEMELPSRSCIICNIKGNLLQDLPALNPIPPDFMPCSCYTEEQHDQFNQVHASDFLLLEEHKLIHHFMCLQNGTFMWTDQECGHFCKDFFPPIEIPTILHKPWAQCNIPIPPSIYNKVCRIIKNKINTGVYELLNSSYHSCRFCVVKKDGKSLHIIHSLELLNQVTIKHSGVTPFTNQIGKHFAGHTCSSMLDLYIRYNKCNLSETLHNLTTFQSLWCTLLGHPSHGLDQLVPIFHNNITYILQPEIPEMTVPYMNNVPIHGPTTRYLLPDGSDKQIPENTGICQFVWEHFQGLNQVVQC